MHECTRMFRRLGYPWELQVNKLQQEYEQIQDMIHPVSDYEMINSVTDDQIADFWLDITHS